MYTHCLTTPTFVFTKVHKTNKVWDYILTVTLHIWYASFAVPQLLQYLTEFDAPAMQSCKPLPCGTGS